MSNSASKSFKRAYLRELDRVHVLNVYRMNMSLLARIFQLSDGVVPLTWLEKTRKSFNPTVLSSPPFATRVRKARESYSSAVPSTVNGARIKRAPRAISFEYFVETRKVITLLYNNRSNSQFGSTHVYMPSIYNALLARALATQVWRFARFSGSEKSLNSETLSSPFSSTRVRTQRES